MAASKPFDSSLLLDDSGNAVSGNWLQRKMSGERLIASRKQQLFNNQTRRNYSGATTVVNPNTHLNPTPGDVDGFNGILAMQANGAEAQGRSFDVKPPLQALSRASLMGGSTRPTVQPRQEAAMPQARRTVVAPQGAVYDDVDQAAQTGSGAAVALARKRQELGLAALDSAISRQRMADQDPDGSQAAQVALGRERHNAEWDQLYGDPRAAASTRSLNALEREANRDEWSKDWATKAPERRFEADQTQRRYVDPVALRGDTALGVADRTGQSRENVAETNAGAKMDSAQMDALAKAVQEMFKQGQPGEARAYGESGGVLPPSNVGQRLQRLQQERPGLTPDNYINLLGEIDDDEYAEAMRILGGA